MDEPLIELTPEWLEYQILVNKSKGASLPSEGKITIDTLKKAITNKESKNKKPKKEDELEEDNCPSMNR